MTRAVFAAILLLMTVAGALAAGWTVSGIVERTAQSRAERIAAAGGHDWLRISADGLRLTLSGEAPDAAAAEAAREALDSAKGPAVLADLVSVAYRPAATPVAASAESLAPRLRVLRDVEGLTLTGVAPNPEARRRFAAALRDAVPGLGLVEMADAADAAAFPHWETLAAAAVGIVGALDHGGVGLSAEGLSVTGLPLPNGETDIAEIGERLAAEGLRLTLDLSAPRPPLSASVFEARSDGDGRLRIDACSAPDSAAASALGLEAAARDVDLSRRCFAAAGRGSSEESLGWVRLALVGLDALRDLGGGTFRIENGRAALSPPFGGDEALILAKIAEARQAAPPAIRVALAPPAAQPTAPERVGEPGVWLRARLTPDLITLTGAAPDEPTRAAVRSYAAAAFGAERVHEGLGLADAAGGANGWRAATLAALDALDRLRSGEAIVHDGRISVEGIAESAASAGAAHRALVSVEGWRGESRIVVDLPAKAASTRLSPARCVDALGALVEGTPIVFAPSSAEIDVESEAVLEALASTLRRCGGEPIEIGGHTDSQGSESYNRRLSRERAEAVRKALIARGAPPDRLVARGYGEDEPIADNETEAGRALNRRIAFTTLAVVETAEEVSE